MGAKAQEDQIAESLIPLSSLIPVLSLTYPFSYLLSLFPPLYFPIHRVMKECLQRVNSTQHGSSGDTNHHQQQLREVDKNYRMLFSKGVTEIECVATIPKIETWSTLERNEATTPGAVSLVKGSHYPGTINSSVFTENRFFSICLMEKWNSSISKNGSYSEYFYPTKWFFFLTSWVWRLHELPHGVAGSVGRNRSSVPLLLSHLVLCLLGAFDRNRAIVISM